MQQIYPDVNNELHRREVRKKQLKKNLDVATADRSWCRVWVLALSFCFLDPCHLFVLVCEEKKVTPGKKRFLCGSASFGDLLLMSFWMYGRRNFDFIQLGPLCKFSRCLKTHAFFSSFFFFCLLCCVFVWLICSSDFEFGWKKWNVMKRFSDFST